MNNDWQGSEEIKENEPTLQHDKHLGEEGVQAIQGIPNATKASETEPISETSETPIIGNPERDSKFWHQQEYDDTCAIVAQQGVIEKHTGQKLSEDELRQEALINNWYESGTMPADVGKLLNSHDVPVGFQGNGDLTMLQNELEQGHDVVTGVDAGYLWKEPSAIGDGHAVWVTGIEEDHEGNIKNVFLNDSGNLEIDGGGEVSADTFQNAWSARDNFMVSTRDPAPISSTSGGNNDL